jgi:hypothetical protein
MTFKELTSYRKKWAVIRPLKKSIDDKVVYIRVLSRFDKNGSHQKSIIKAIGERDKLKKKLLKKLGGIDYEYMMKSLQKATILSKRKNLKAFIEFDPFKKK